MILFLSLYRFIAFDKTQCWFFGRYSLNLGGKSLFIPLFGFSLVSKKIILLLLRHCYKMIHSLLPPYEPVYSHYIHVLGQL